MSTREQRAARRRADWHGQIVRTGESKGCMYASLPVGQRLVTLARLNERAWVAAGRSMPAPTPRADWPGEVFEIHCRG